MTIKRTSNKRDKSLKREIFHLKSKLANELNENDKDAIIIYLAKKFNLIKKDSRKK